MITDLIQSSASRLEGYRATSDISIKRAMASRQSSASSLIAGGGNATSSPFFFDESQQKAVRQYRHFRDVPYAAIRPIAVKMADLPLHVGMVKRRRRGGTRQTLGASSLRTKSLMPAFIKSISENVEPVDNHEFIEDIMDPNPYMTYWATMFCTVVSLYLTGRSYWWMDEDGDGGTQFWYLPSTWVTPLASDENPFAAFGVKPPWAMGDPHIVDGEDMAFFSIPDPANPLASYAPLQSQARAIDTDDAVQEAQLVTMRDGVQPKTIIRVGKMPEVSGIPGSGERIELTAAQRKQLVSEITTWYAGAAKRGLPFVVDRKIEGIEPFGRSAAELDFVNGAKLTSDRVHHGLGVNRIVTGATEGANRAQATVADTYLYSLVVNPLGTHMSQTMTKDIGPRYSSDTERAVIWIEKAEAQDPALIQGRMNLAVKAGAVTKKEVRQWASTGEVVLPERDDDDELVSASGKQGQNGQGEQGGGIGDQTGASEGDARDDGGRKSLSEGDELDWLMKGVEIGRKQAEADLLTKADDKYTPPESARNNARRVLKWRKEHGDEVKGMTAVGWRRASQLASGKPVSLDIVKRMAQFARHEQNYIKARAKQKSEGKPPWAYAAIVAWLGWGGSSGILSWAKRISSANSKSFSDELETKRGNPYHDAKTGQFASGGGSGGSGVKHETKSKRTKAEIAKASAKRVASEIQRYAEEHNEPQFAAEIGGQSLDDNEPIDVVTEINGKTHGIELKTMVNNSNDKITMKREAMERKAKWERKNKGAVHTVVLDDREVFNANGPGKHDTSKRKIYYRRGYGSFRVGSMKEVGSMDELAQLMTARRNQIPKSAGGTKKG